MVTREEAMWREAVTNDLKMLRDRNKSVMVYAIFLHLQVFLVMGALLYLT